MTRKIAPSKAETGLLPPFPTLPLGRIFVPITEEHFAAASADIKAAGVVGFDTESKPTFVTGDVSEGPHIVQFALSDKAYIFQLHREICRPWLIELLQSAAVLKVGFGLESDRGQMQAKLGVRLAALLDLNALFRKDGYASSMGVRAAVGVAFGQKFHKSKKATTSNWALPDLSASQLLYAANDAFAALRVYQALQQEQTTANATAS